MISDKAIARQVIVFVTCTFTYHPHHHQGQGPWWSIATSTVSCHCSRSWAPCRVQTDAECTQIFLNGSRPWLSGSASDSVILKYSNCVQWSRSFTDVLTHLQCTIRLEWNSEMSAPLWRSWTTIRCATVDVQSATDRQHQRSGHWRRWLVRVVCQVVEIYKYTNDRHTVHISRTLLHPVCGILTVSVLNPRLFVQTPRKVPAIMERRDTSYLSVDIAETTAFS